MNFILTQPLIVLAELEGEYMVKQAVQYAPIERTLEHPALL